MKGKSNMKLIVTLSALAAILGFMMFASWSVGSVAAAPTLSSVPTPLPPARDLMLTAGDGARVAATYWPGVKRDAPAVLLLHGNGASRLQTMDAAIWLSRQGYAAMTIDFRGHGESNARPHSFGLFESRDALAAVRWLKQGSGGAPVAAIGISLGGAAALIGDDGPLPVDALVLQAVYPDIRRAIRNRIASLTTAGPAWALEPLLSLQSKPRFGVWPSRLSPIDAIRRYRGPVMVLGGAADSFTPPEESRALAEAAPGPHWLWLFDRQDHAAMSDQSGPVYRRVLIEFLERTIGRPN